MNRSLAAVCAIGAFVLAGCATGGREGDTPTPAAIKQTEKDEPAGVPSLASPPSEAPTAESTEESAAPEEALEAAVREYSTLFFTGAGLGVWDMWSARCHDLGKRDEVVSTVVAFADLTGARDNRMTSFEIDAIEGERARVTYDFEVGDYGQVAQPWSQENGRWYYDAC